MKRTLTSAAALALSASTAVAAGLDRSGQSVEAVFADPGSTELGFGLVTPSVTGEDTDGGGGQYDVGERYSLTTITYTNAVNDRFAYSVIFDQPYGADVDYGQDPTASNLGGTMADLDSAALTFVGRYNVTDRFSLFGGVGIQRIDADVDLNGNAYADAITTSAVTAQFNAGLPAAAPQLDSETLGAALAGDPAAVSAIDGTYGTGTVSGGLAPSFQTARGGFVAGDGYAFSMEDTTRPNYLIGAAYEIPDIAFRLAGTYRFETSHSADTTETVFGRTVDSDIDFVTPQSFNLEFQTGIAPGTVVTASYRWTEFSAVDLVPTGLGSDLVNLDDGERYTLGIGRAFDRTLAGSLTLSYEPFRDSDTVSPLGPTEGLFGIALGGRYTDGPMSLSGGISYAWLGDAVAGVADRPVASFEDNHAVGFGFQARLTF
jgi:long-subunit fatty acid transport protein